MANRFWTKITKPLLKRGRSLEHRTPYENGSANVETPGPPTATVEAVMRLTSLPVGKLSPTAITCSNYLWTLAYGMDYKIKSTDVDARLVADAYRSILNHGVAVLDKSDRGLRCVDVAGAQLSFNAYGDPVAGIWQAYDGSMRPADLILTGPDRALSVEYADLMGLETVLYSKLRHYVGNLGITGLLVKAVGAHPDTIKAISRKLSLLSEDENTGAIIVTDEDVEVIDYNRITVDELVSDEKLITLRNMICGAYGVPPDVIWNEGSNRATAEQAAKNVVAFTVYPLLYYICTELTNRGYTVEIDPLAAQEIAQVAADTHDTYYEEDAQGSKPKDYDGEDDVIGVQGRSKDPKND